MSRLRWESNLPKSQTIQLRSWTVLYYIQILFDRVNSRLIRALFFSDFSDAGGSDSGHESKDGSSSGTSSSRFSSSNDDSSSAAAATTNSNPGAKRHRSSNSITMVTIYKKSKTEGEQENEYSSSEETIYSEQGYDKSQLTLCLKRKIYGSVPSSLFLLD